MTPPAAPAAPAAPEPTAAEDLAVLFPDVDVPVRDPDTGASVSVTVHEFRFLEGLRLSATIRPLLEAIADAAPLSSAASEVNVAAIAGALTEHAEVWLASLAQATGRDAGWIARLSDQDGNALSDAMWRVNGPFFRRRLVEVLSRRLRQDGPSRSPQSSMPSSARDTDADTATSPSV